jgi:hypothetical protein
MNNKLNTAILDW